MRIILKFSDVYKAAVMKSYVEFCIKIFVRYIKDRYIKIFCWYLSILKLYNYIVQAFSILVTCTCKFDTFQSYY